MDTFHRTLNRSPAFLAAMLLVGCGLSEDAPMEFTHVNLADQPGRLQTDFNVHVDQVRLVLIVGPT